MHAIRRFCIPGGPCRRWFSCGGRWRPGCDGGSLEGVRVHTRWASFRQGRHGTGRGCGVPRNIGHPACGSRGDCGREGFVELLAPGVQAPFDAAILSGTAWLDALHGHAPLRKQLPEGTAELGAAVGLAPQMTTGKVSRTRSKAARMSRTGGAVTSSAAVGFETGSQTARG